MFTEFKSQIEKIVSLTDKEWRAVENAFVFREVPKKFELVKEGDIANEIYYIKKGLMRLFYRKEGEEFTAFLLPSIFFPRASRASFGNRPAFNAWRPWKNASCWCFAVTTSCGFMKKYPR